MSYGPSGAPIPNVFTVKVISCVILTVTPRGVQSTPFSFYEGDNIVASVLTTNRYTF